MQRESGWLELSEADRVAEVHYRPQHWLERLSHVRVTMESNPAFGYSGLFINLLFRVGKDALSHLLTCGNCWINRTPM